MIDVKQQRILLIGSQGLFLQGICDILERESDLKVLGPHATSVDVTACIEAIHPDVIIITEESSINADLLSRALRTYPDMPIIRVGLKETVVHVYRSEQVVATRTSLLHAIRMLSTADGDE
ncbi:MAG: hypothetical protein GY832_40855 [Chloroflexi bacterium]|nr:hypothetical protein [Chloroflexota bacterium]